jgi:hypothetical protein
MASSGKLTGWSPGAASLRRNCGGRSILISRTVKCSSADTAKGEDKFITDKRLFCSWVPVQVFGSSVGDSSLSFLGRFWKNDGMIRSGEWTGVSFPTAGRLRGA